MSTVMGTWRTLVKQANGESSTSNTALSGPNYLAAREELAKRMLKAHPADMVVMPTLLFREGRYSGTRLKWDSVKRPVVMTERAAGASTAMIKGKDRATSVRITLFDREGHRVFERHGGIEPMTRYSMNDAFYFSEFQIKSKLRDDLFEDPWMITDGVRIALEPWLVWGRLKKKRLMIPSRRRESSKTSSWGIGDTRGLAVSRSIRTPRPRASIAP
jgi:hypothetical protein